jgi:hypothetical protein
MPSTCTSPSLLGRQPWRGSTEDSGKRWG